MQEIEFEKQTADPMFIDEEETFTRKTKNKSLLEKKNNAEEIDMLVGSPRRSRTPKSKKNIKAAKSAAKTPSSKSKTAETTPKTKCKTADVVENVAETSRYNLRQRIKQELASMKTVAVDSDPEDSDENRSWEDDSENDIASEEDGLSNEVSTPKRKKGTVVNSFAEGYFSAQRQSKSATSNRTMSKVNLKQADIEQLSEILRNIPECHRKEKTTLFQYYTSLFSKWIFLLQEGFNILLYGIGSKQKILNSFCNEYLKDTLYVVIHGFFPSINIKQILCTITEDAMGCEMKFSNIYGHAEFIKKHYLTSKTDLYIIIHNIDASALRGEKNQTVLALLAAVPKIHFLASVDHINCSLIWDQIMLSQFKWTWFDCTTFEPYINETSYENTILRDQSTHLLLSSLLHVYRSLTPNGQGVFLLLAKHQNNGKSSTNYLGMAFSEWYQQCREAFLVNSEMTMQAQLSEFKNHKLLALRKSPDSVEHWYIPIDGATLEQFLESCE